LGRRVIAGDTTKAGGESPRPLAVSGRSFALAA